MTNRSDQKYVYYDNALCRTGVSQHFFFFLNADIILDKFCFCIESQSSLRGGVEKYRDKKKNNLFIIILYILFHYNFTKETNHSITYYLRNCICDNICWKSVSNLVVTISNVACKFSILKFISILGLYVFNFCKSLLIEVGNTKY